VSDYLVLSAVSRALREILWQEFEPDPVIAAIVPSQSAIVFANPTETARDSANRLSLWLYEVSENEFVKNQPLQREGNAMRFPPLPLDLSYLVTPFGPSGEADHLLLGKTMQVLYDNAITLLRDPVANVFEELRLVLARLTLEELTRVWEALREPYRLSVSYQVRIGRIESLRTSPTARVLDRIAEYAAVPVGGGVP
jgi:Pvc16 N-terminal domain